MSLLCDRSNFLNVYIFVPLLVPLKSLLGRSGIFHFKFYLLTKIFVAREKMFSTLCKGISQASSSLFSFKKKQIEKFVKLLMFFFIQIF